MLSLKIYLLSTELIKSSIKFSIIKNTAMLNTNPTASPIRMLKNVNKKNINLDDGNKKSCIVINNLRNFVYMHI